MSTHIINYKGITESYSIFYVEILIPDGLGPGTAYTVLQNLVSKVYNHIPNVRLREVDDLLYGAPRAIIVGIADHGEWPEIVLKQEDVENVRVSKVWPLEGRGKQGK